MEALHTAKFGPAPVRADDDHKAVLATQFAALVLMFACVRPPFVTVPEPGGGERLSLPLVLALAAACTYATWRAHASAFGCSAHVFPW